MDQQIPKQLQDKISQYQNLQGQLQLASMQRQQVSMQAADIVNALKALEEAGHGKIYRAAGPLLIEAGKEASVKRLNEDKELAEAREKMLEKQEKKLTEKFEEMRQEIQGMLKSMGGAGAT